MYRYIKRGLDVVCASLGIIGTFPIWIIAICGILISDPGKVFYVSTRLGRDNKPFKMYKFRSMKVDQGADESNLRADSSRIFPFGNLIRALKIDELPQLINVLNSSMSVIGPRPVAVDQKHLFRTGRWDQARQVSVGLSGPAAIYDFIYGDDITDEAEYKEKVFPTRRELEFVYVNKIGLLYDIKMVYYTIVAICYRAFKRNPDWILKNLLSDAEASFAKANESGI